MPPYKTNSASHKFHGNELDTMIAVAMIEYSGTNAFERRESLRDNPYSGDPMLGWAWGLGWRLGRHLEMHGGEATR